MNYDDKVSVGLIITYDNKSWEIVEFRNGIAWVLCPQGDIAESWIRENHTIQNLDDRQANYKFSYSKERKVNNLLKQIDNL